MMKYANKPLSAQSQLQQLSALMDGDLDMAQTQALLQSNAMDSDLLQAWSSYHAIGDALRVHAIDTADLALPAASRSVQAQAMPDHTQSAANDSVFRWKMLAGFAAVAAVGSIIWSVAGVPAGPSGAQLAQASAPPVVNSMVTSVASPAAEGVVMLRDPRLDEFLAAHKQFGGASALQQPAGFLRNATFQSSAR
jgi:sigma-E factor negative regulatory protein RseA